MEENFSSRTIVCEGSVPPDVLERNALKLIVLTSSDEYVAMADMVAEQTPTYERYVVWVKNPNFAILKQQFPGPPTFEAGDYAFSVSTINKTGKIHHSGEPVGPVRIDMAYVEASLPELNH